MLRNAIIIFGIIFSAVISHVFAASVTVTTVINYQPTLTDGVIKKGECFASSIAVARQDAWRCNVGNEIYDPCFATKDANKLVCGVDPINMQQGFFLQLTKPLPVADAVNVTPQLSLWMLKLADGSVCTPYTGTMPIIPTVNGVLAVKYGCVDNNAQRNPRIMVGILDDSVKVGNLWQAKKVYFLVSAKGKPRVVKAEVVNVNTVWQ